MMGATTVDGRTLVYFHTQLEASDLKRQRIVDFPTAIPATTGAIPGLHIMNDFVTVEEEAQIIKALDSGTWTKLLNRRVQHFGFEFKYGTNDVDSNASLG